MGVEAVDHALRRRRAELERLAEDLLDLEAHPGNRLLEGARLCGETLRRWEEAQAETATLWWLFDAFRRTLARAEQIRAGRARPGPAELAELTTLLTGPSVEAKVEDVPVERRSLIRPLGEWLTLDQVLTRMDAAYHEIARTAAAVDEAWTVLAPVINRAEAVRDEAVALEQALGASDAELGRLTAELAAARDAARGDPLTHAAADRRAEFDRIVTELEERRDLLAQAVQIKEDHAGRMNALAELIARVGAAEREVLTARDEVLVKIASPALPPMPDQARNLHDRFMALSSPHAAGEWIELARHTTDLERAAEEALAQAREARALITGLIDRRDELRGRLEAFRAKAVRLGRAEDTRLGDIYRRARDLLWTAPCDLRQATVAVASYQRAIRQSGADG